MKMSGSENNKENHHNFSAEISQVLQLKTSLYNLYVRVFVILTIKL